MIEIENINDNKCPLTSKTCSLIGLSFVRLMVTSPTSATLLIFSIN